MTVLEKNFNKALVENKLKNEWLETNGLGSYASSTCSLCHTRKYHGLLVVASNKATKRNLLFSKFDEFIFDKEAEDNISLNYYEPGVYVPFSSKQKISFENENNPIFKYTATDFSLEKKLVMLHEENTIIVSYKFNKVKKKYLKLNPLVAFRDFHELIHENQNKNFQVLELENGIRLESTDSEHKLFIQFSSKVKTVHNNFWYKNILYQEEAARGFAATEDLYCPVSFEIDLESNPEFYIGISTEKLSDKKSLKNLFQEEIKRRRKSEKKVLCFSTKKEKLLSRLNKARKDFIVRTDSNEYTILAGYHWFNSWGRDTFISLPGLLLKSPEKDLYINILKSYLALQKNGLIPNMTGSSIEDSAYNCVDASLWMFWSIGKFLDEFNNIEWLIEIWKDLRKIYLAYYLNQAPGLRHDQDLGLLETGSINDTLSWMDAQVDGTAASPRYGYLIEINALWYETNILMFEFASIFKDDEIIYKSKKTIKAISSNFEKIFWIEDQGYYADYIHDEKQNLCLRPNQLFALGMESLKLNENHSLSAMTKITKELLTPLGLRTLAPSDPNFCAKYEGNGRTRDYAYHNGTVWPWLLGAYTDALLNCSINKSDTKNKLKKLLLNFDAELDHAGINSISEIYDATQPYQARGCIAQAWSVSEIRRALLST